MCVIRIDQPHLTCVFNLTLSCPVFDDHRQWPDPRIKRNVGFDHLRILKSKSVVHIDIARELSEKRCESAFCWRLGLTIETLKNAHVRLGIE